jgi:iron-sulfur cluster repair protein YtfE (RIC family)
MHITNSLMKQHDELILIVSKINEKKEENLNISEISQLIIELAKKLKMHVAVEKKFLYPKILSYATDSDKEKARNVLNDMDMFNDHIVEYMKNYFSELKISKDVNGFFYDSKGLLNHLKQLFEKEKTILYPIVDSIC